MDKNRKDIFKQISNKDELQKLYKDMVQSHCSLICKGTGDDVFTLTPRSLEVGQKISCSLKLESVPPKSKNDNIVGQFMIGTEKYFIYTTLTSSGQNWLLDGSVDLYHLQRRQSYRIRVPESYKSKISLINVDRKIEITDGRLFDMSSGGVRLTLPHDEPVLKEGDRLECQLQIGQRETLSFKGLIRHVKPQKITGALQMIGIQFTPITAIMENKLFAITMELHREFFAKKSV